MSKRAITFPQFTSGMRRNAETGVEIHRTRTLNGGSVFSVWIPTVNQGKVRLNGGWGMAEARRRATAAAEIIREQLAADYDKAVHEEYVRNETKVNAEVVAVFETADRFRGAELPGGALAGYADGKRMALTLTLDRLAEHRASDNIIEIVRATARDLGVKL